MVRFILLSVLLTILLRALLRLWAGFVQGVRGPSSGGSTSVPQRGVHMVRDPVCGTFVVPERAVALSSSAGRQYFCSDACRDKYRTRQTQANPTAHGRTA